MPGEWNGQQLHAHLPLQHALVCCKQHSFNCSHQPGCLSCYVHFLIMLAYTILWGCLLLVFAVVQVSVFQLLLPVA